ncbi:DUF5682 family protein [Aureimonas sp. ME7]|uniref:DUF5682 family protein n=1 Tax=Aureimonas sp. ME7 TaxID=2744252 RepID=UPI0015F58DAE|nr:DUF5682 family protein [Aureimonas sp. ME7]
MAGSTEAAFASEGFSAWGERLLAGERGCLFFPIRHHSPACAHHLAQALAETRPRALVIEMPADFGPILPLLAHPETRNPVSVVSITEARGERVPVAHWPFSDSAPEWTALRWANAAGIPILLADLPSGTRLALEEERANQARPDEPPAPLLLTGEEALAGGRYADALVKRLCARDFNEAWDRLFESRIADRDWRLFFRDIGVHCFLTRLLTPEAEIADDDTRPRETFMRAAVAQALETPGDGPIAVVTGGFHTPVLLDPPDVAEIAIPKPAPATPYLVRYTHEALNRINGYGAGMPSPRWYERLAAAAGAGAADPGEAAAGDLVLSLAKRLRAERPGFAPPLPALVETLAHARGLASLRGLPGPGRCEVVDAARSCLVKDEDPRYGSPLMEMLGLELGGEGIGEVPRAAGSPPLVEALRARARALRFNVEDGTERARALDLHRKPRHLAASRFLHAMVLLGTPFAQCRQGPDWSGGVSTDIITEQWTYRWTPAVETRLVALCTDGDTIERVAVAVLRREIARLSERAEERNAAAAVRLLVTAAQAGMAGACGPLVRAIGEAIGADPDFGRTVSTLAALDNLCRGRRILGLADTDDPGRLRRLAYARAIDLLPNLRDAGEEDVPALVSALAALNDVAEGAGSGESDLPALALDLLDEGIADLSDAALEPRVAGAVAALSYLAGRLTAEELGTAIAGALRFGGEPKGRTEPLVGVLAVQPALLRRVPALLAAVDEAMAALSAEDFLQLLPGLRYAFSSLAPGETDDLAAEIARGHASALDLAPRLPDHLSETELLEGARLDAELVALWREDGLGAWLEPQAGAHTA